MAGEKRWTKDDVKDAMRGRAREFLVNVGGFDAAILDDRKEHPCPWCGGKTRFRLVDEQAGAVYCSNCFNSGNGDAFAAISRNQGWDFPTTLNECARYLGWPVAAPCAEKSQTRPEIPAEKAKPERQAVPLASPAVLHRAYGAILSQLTLSAEHRQHLRGRGLSEATIERAEFRTLVKGSEAEAAAVVAANLAVGDEIRGVPGVHDGRLLTFGGIVIPVRNVGREIVALKVRYDKPESEASDD
jgi:hypothetical protein